MTGPGCVRLLVWPGVPLVPPGAPLVFPCCPDAGAALVCHWCAPAAAPVCPGLPWCARPGMPLVFVCGEQNTATGKICLAALPLTPHVPMVYP